jgi:hypothetical protein
MPASGDVQQITQDEFTSFQSYFTLIVLRKQIQSETSSRRTRKEYDGGCPINSMF